jgi:hypothetical protein
MLLARDIWVVMSPRVVHLTRGCSGILVHVHTAEVGNILRNSLFYHVVPAETDAL